MTTTALRHWCCNFQYPGLKRTMFGTIEMPKGAGEMEVIGAMRSKMLEHLPDGFTITECVPGAIFFNGETE